MNAHTLLTSQGWRGSGHTLHPTSDSTGLSRPLLVSQKANTFGVGKKQHKTADLWWMNAFDKTLKGLDTSNEGKVIQTVTNAGLDMVAKGGAKYVGNSGGLYAGFIKGEPLSGTITPEESSIKQTAGYKEPSPKRRRKGEESKESKGDRRARKAAKRALRARETAAEEENAVEVVDDVGENKPETKEERREQKRQKLARKAKQEREAEEVPSESKKKKKKRKD